MGIKFVEGVLLMFLRKLDAEPQKEIRSHRAIVLTSVMSKWYASVLSQHSWVDSFSSLGRSAE